ncbi:DUF2459 domain-containing protein [Asticcacaulis solisilvae]|uniref:DUF2459 domain-containing protein n=1 Tax=Asticcacaulis solisilvae TaxID=1217274 RepID=UPI003FD8F216
MRYWPKTVWLRGLLALCGLYLVLALVTLRHGDRALYPAESDTVTVYVIDNGFHTDIAIPANEVAPGSLLAEAAQPAAGAPWLVIGWGDAGFYTAKGFSAARAVDGLRALFWINNPSVIRVFGVSNDPGRLYDRKTALPVTLSRAGFTAMIAHMQASFVEKDGRPVVYPVPGTTDAFYDSREHFSIARDCNNWTADQLNAAGLPTAPMLDGLEPLFRLDLRLRTKVR